MAFYRAMDWHAGEKQIHKLTHNLREDNPTSPFLTPHAAAAASRYSLMALGTLDAQDRPWCTVWGTGEPPLAQQVAPSVLGVRSTVDGSFDPVVQELFGDKMDGEVVREEPPGRMVSGLSIELEERGRQKLYGRMLAGALSAKDELDTSEPVPEQSQDSNNPKGKVADVQLVLKIEQSLGNCPKYLNKKHITSNSPQPELLSSSNLLSAEAIDLVHRADMLFVASANAHEDMDMNHRGGPKGFIRVSNPKGESKEGSTIVWPEYSGNNLYQTLGNLQSTPRAGLCIPDFNSSDVLYLTGNTEILIGKAASAVIAKSNLAVRFTVTSARHVKNGLPFKGTNLPDAAEGRSPYNPRVRYLTSERVDETSHSSNDSTLTAKLIKKTTLTPTITRYRFSLSSPQSWKAGQYVALEFSDELDMGYSHMRDDDPTSLNDDFIRTFTVSSPPQALGEHGEEFEVTIRKVGSITGFLSWQKEGGIEVAVRAFGGDFSFDFSWGEEREEHKKGVVFIAAGIGITPLLPQIPGMIQSNEIARLRVLWTIGIRDVNLVATVLKDFPELAARTTVFITGDIDSTALSDSHKKKTGVKKTLSSIQAIESLGIHQRRLTKEDLTSLDSHGNHDNNNNKDGGGAVQYYLCTAPALRTQIQSWLPGQTLIYENFDY